MKAASQLSYLGGCSHYPTELLLYEAGKEASGEIDGLLLLSLELLRDHQKLDPSETPAAHAAMHAFSLL